MSFTVRHHYASAVPDDGNPNEVGPSEWNADHDVTGNLLASEIGSGAALTTANDTNVTLTAGAFASSALLLTASITAGWTGTLAAARLNANVAQGVTNDTNITGSIAAQVLTLAWAGTLSPARGGTGIANNVASTLTISGNFGTTLTVSGATALTLPTSGTLATTSNKLSAFAATTSAELAGVISDETGSGALVFATSPSLVTPALGAARATTLIVGSSVTVPASDLFVSSGNSTTLPTTSGGATAHFGAADTISPVILTDAFGANGSFVFRRANNTAASPTALTTNDIILNMTGVGYGTTAYAAAAKAALRFTAGEPWSDTAQGTYITLHTAANGGTALAEAVRILGAGNVQFSNTANFTANGAVATVLGVIGPTGSHTTVQKWLTIVDNGGTTGYIPVF